MRYWILTIALFTPGLSIADVTSQCASLASTLKEYKISTQSTAFLNSVFDQYCEQSGEARTTAAGAGLDLVVKAIPIKFTGSYGSSGEGFRNFCKSYSSVVNSSDRQYSYEERITSKALDTIDSCLRITGNNTGTVVTHEIPSQLAINFFLAREALHNPRANPLPIRVNS